MKNFFKNLFDYLLNLVFVPKCAGCRNLLPAESHSCFCDDCRYMYESAKERECVICGKRLSLCMCPTPKLEKNRVHRLTKLMYYFPQSNDLAVNQAIFKLKKTAEKHLVDMFAYDMAQTLKPLLEHNKERYIVTYAPRTRKAILRYGHDHMELLSRRVAEILDLPWAKLIIRLKGAEQKSLSYAERLRNVKVVYNRKNKLDIKGKYAIIIDDVITTSATLSTCARLLRKNGMRSVVAAVIAVSTSAYNDEKRRSATGVLE